MWLLNILLQYFDFGMSQSKYFALWSIYMYIIKSLHVNPKQNGCDTKYSNSWLQNVIEANRLSYEAISISIIRNMVYFHQIYKKYCLQHSHHKMFSLKWKAEKTFHSFNAFNSNNYVMSNYTLITHWSTLNKKLK